MVGDAYARSPHAGRGGWSWYTGSAGWMYRAGLESILGLQRRGAIFVVDPCIPSSWPEYQIVWQFLDTRYEITVSNPTRRCRGVGKATLDGAPVSPAAIPLVDDGRLHDVQIVLGDARRDPGLLVGRAGARSGSEARSRSLLRVGFSRHGCLRGDGLFAALGKNRFDLGVEAVDDVY